MTKTEMLAAISKGNDHPNSVIAMRWHLIENGMVTLEEMAKALTDLASHRPGAQESYDAEWVKAKADMHAKRNKRSTAFVPGR